METVADYKFTQADVSRLIFKHEGAPEAFVQEIVELSRPPATAQVDQS
jgi:hypothetical protein